MGKRKVISKIILLFLFLTSLQACGSSFELIENEVTLYVGQTFNPETYLSEEHIDNENISIDSKVDTSIPGTYEVAYTFEDTKRILKVYVLADPIILSFNEITIESGEIFNPTSYLKEGSKVDDIDIKSNVKTSTPGDYVVVYSYDGIEKIIRVFVRDLIVTLSHQSMSIDLGSTFDPLEHVSLNFPTSKKLSVEHNVDVNRVGEYTVNYINGQSKQSMKVIVNDVSPFLTTTQTSIKHGSAFDPKSYLTSSDRNNPDIIINNPVKTNLTGDYVVTYKLGNVEKSLEVTVLAAATTSTKPTSPTPTTPVSPTPTKPTSPAPTTPITPQEPSKPTVPSSKLSIVSLTSPVSPNDYATITAKGKPNETYYIEVIYKSGPSTAQGLEPQEADSDGLFSWTWKIGPRTSAGKWQIRISGNGEAVSTYITVQ